MEKMNAEHELCVNDRPDTERQQDDNAADRVDELKARRYGAAGKEVHGTQAWREDRAITQPGSRGKRKTRAVARHAGRRGLWFSRVRA